MDNIMKFEVMVTATLSEVAQLSIENLVDILEIDTSGSAWNEESLSDSDGAVDWFDVCWMLDAIENAPVDFNGEDNFQQRCMDFLLELEYALAPELDKEAR